MVKGAAAVVEHALEARLRISLADTILAPDTPKLLVSPVTSIGS